MLAFRQRQVSAPGDGLHGRQRTIATCAVLLNVCMANLDAAIANTALPTIARDLNTTEAQSIWVVGAYQLAMVASLLPAAALGEIVGLRRISMGGLVLFTLASLVCGLAPSLEWLVAGRVVQGMSAAGILGVGVAMMRFIYPHALLGRGMGLNALVVGLSFAAGPSAASAVLSLTSWHWLFLMNVPLGLIGIAMGLYALPPTIRSARRFDGWAAALCALFLATTVFALNTAAQGASWGSVATNATIAIASLAVLLKRQGNRPGPILAIDLLRKPVFALSSICSFFTMITQALAFVSLPFLFQTLLGYSQVETGFLITPWPALVAFAAPLAGRLSDRIPAGLLGGAGLAVLSLGMLLLATMPADPDALDVAWRMAVCGAGFGFFQSPNMRTMITSVPPERSGGAGGMSSVIGNLGQACGVAIVAALFNLFGAHGAVIALWLGAAFALLGSGASFMRLRHRPAMGLEPLETLEDRPSP